MLPVVKALYKYYSYGNWERQRSQRPTYFVDREAEVATSSACLMIFGIQSEKLAGLPKSRGRFDNYVISMYVFLKQLLFQRLTVADTSAQGHPAAQQQHWHEMVGLLYQRLTGKRGSKAGGTGITPLSVTSNGTFTELAWWPADPNCWVTLLCFGLFVKHETIFEGKSQWRDMAAPARGPPGPPGPCRAVLAFVWRGARGSPHSPTPEEWAACFNISFQFTAAT